MKRRTTRMRTLLLCVGMVVVAGSASLSVASAKDRKPVAISPDAVLTWNTNTVKAVRASTPTKVQIDGMVYMSYVQAAVYDAVTKIEGRYQPYHDFTYTVVPGASVQAAVATAAQTTLDHYLPDQQATVDAEYTAYLATLTGDVADGVAVGQAAANDIIAFRAGDGLNAATPSYGGIGPILPGQWQLQPGAPPATQCAPAANYPAATTPVAFWSTEARCAIVPPSAGPENFGNKFPGEAAVYMGIVHVAIYDAAVAIEGGSTPYAIARSAPGASPEAAIATAARDTLVGLPGLGLSPTQQAILDGDYAAYVNAIPGGSAKDSGIDVGRKVAAAVLALRKNDGLEKNPLFADLNPPPPGPGIWQPNASGPVLGLRLPGVRPLALESASQFRPDGRSRDRRTRGGLNALTSQAYADDFNEVKNLGSLNSTGRTVRSLLTTPRRSVSSRPRRITSHRARVLDGSVALGCTASRRLRASDRIDRPMDERDTRSLVERLGPPVFVPPPDSQEDLVPKHGVTPEEAAGRTPDGPGC